MSRRILIILGHSSSQSMCASLARNYADAARQSGAEVRLLSLGEMYFDPILRHGYAHAQPLEPDLRDAQIDIAWAQHLVWVYPIWWGGLPALLKGFLDRIFLPGFAFKYRANSVLWDRLLTGRTAEPAGDYGHPAVVLQMGTAPTRSPANEADHPGVQRDQTRAHAQLWPGGQLQRCSASGLDQARMQAGCSCRRLRSDSHALHMRGGRQVNSLRKAPRVQGICVLKAVGRVQRSRNHGGVQPIPDLLVVLQHLGHHIGWSEFGGCRLALSLLLFSSSPTRVAVFEGIVWFGHRSFLGVLRCSP